MPHSASLLSSLSLAAAVCGLTLAAPRAGIAAPDHTLGMALMSAIVDADGTLLHGSGATGATHVALGSYAVAFDRDVSACTYAATSSGFHLSVTAFPVAEPDEVEVQFENSALSLVDTRFHLLVFCSK